MQDEPEPEDIPEKEDLKSSLNSIPADECFANEREESTEEIPWKIEAKPLPKPPPENKK